MFAWAALAHCADERRGPPASRCSRRVRRCLPAAGPWLAQTEDFVVGMRGRTSDVEPSISEMRGPTKNGAQIAARQRRSPWRSATIDRSDRAMDLTDQESHMFRPAPSVGHANDDAGARPPCCASGSVIAARRGVDRREGSLHGDTGASTAIGQASELAASPERTDRHRFPGVVRLHRAGLINALPGGPGMPECKGRGGQGRCAPADCPDAEFSATWPDGRRDSDFPIEPAADRELDEASAARWRNDHQEKGNSFRGRQDADARSDSMISMAGHGCVFRRNSMSPRSASGMRLHGRAAKFESWR